MKGGDERERELERQWEATGAPMDGLAFYSERARRGPLPCPSCGHKRVLGSLRSFGPSTADTGDMLAYPRLSQETCARCGTLWCPLASAYAARELAAHEIHVIDSGAPSEPTTGTCGIAFTYPHMGAGGTLDDLLRRRQYACSFPPGHAGRHGASLCSPYSTHQPDVIRSHWRGDFAPICPQCGLRLDMHYSNEPAAEPDQRFPVMAHGFYSNGCPHWTSCPTCDERFTDFGVWASHTEACPHHSPLS